MLKSVIILNQLAMITDRAIDEKAIPYFHCYDASPTTRYEHSDVLNFIAT